MWLAIHKRMAGKQFGGTWLVAVSRRCLGRAATLAVLSRPCVCGLLVFIGTGVAAPRNLAEAFQGRRDTCLPPCDPAYPPYAESRSPDERSMTRQKQQPRPFSMCLLEFTARLCLLTRPDLKCRVVLVGLCDSGITALPSRYPISATFCYTHVTEGIQVSIAEEKKECISSYPHVSVSGMPMGMKTVIPRPDPSGRGWIVAYREQKCQQKMGMKTATEMGIVWGRLYRSTVPKYICRKNVIGYHRNINSWARPPICLNAELSAGDVGTERRRNSIVNVGFVLAEFIALILRVVHIDRNLARSESIAARRGASVAYKLNIACRALYLRPSRIAGPACSLDREQPMDTCADELCRRGCRSEPSKRVRVTFFESEKPLAVTSPDPSDLLLLDAAGPPVPIMTSPSPVADSVPPYARQNSKTYILVANTWWEGLKKFSRYREQPVTGLHPRPAGSLPGFRKWQSCRTMPLVGGFSLGYPVFPHLPSGAAPFSPHSTLIGAQHLDVKNRSNLRIQSMVQSTRVGKLDAFSSATRNVRRQGVDIACVPDFSFLYATTRSVRYCLELLTRRSRPVRRARYTRCFIHCMFSIPGLSSQWPVGRMQPATLTPRCLLQPFFFTTLLKELWCYKLHVATGACMRTCHVVACERASWRLFCAEFVVGRHPSRITELYMMSDLEISVWCEPPHVLQSELLNVVAWNQEDLDMFLWNTPQRGLHASPESLNSCCWRSVTNQSPTNHIPDMFMGDMSGERAGQGSSVTRVDRRLLAHSSPNVAGHCPTEIWHVESPEGGTIACCIQWRPKQSHLAFAHYVAHNAGCQIAVTTLASNTYATITVGQVEAGLVRKLSIVPLSTPATAFTCQLQSEAFVVSGQWQLMQLYAYHQSSPQQTASNCRRRQVHIRCSAPVSSQLCGRGCTVSYGHADNMAVIP
ncbi:hypothetical protein PR048_002393 [Dryococelus australis]|uniref:Uncharacterized protein n=1 Tax=Dryococelus australis TaxID=614101 RepID=A0ABQ9IK28_9NEOP|nr:hypothetical protein PR048_002393 [Dryococelus australis]